MDLNADLAPALAGWVVVDAGLQMHAPMAEGSLLAASLQHFEIGAPAVRQMIRLAQLGVGEFQQAAEMQTHVRIGHLAFRHLPNVPENYPHGAYWIEGEPKLWYELERRTTLPDIDMTTGYQTMLALEVMTLAVSDQPPRTSAEAINRGSESVIVRVKAITERFTT